MSSDTEFLYKKANQYEKEGRTEEAARYRRLAAHEISAETRTTKKQRQEALQTIWLLATVLLAFLVVAFLISRLLDGADMSDSTTISPEVGDALDGLLLRPDALPETYTGELVDIDVDGNPDVALFGDPEAPILRALVRDTGRDWTPWLAAVALVLAAVFGPLAKAWAEHRWSSSDAVASGDD